MEAKLLHCTPEVWAGVECTINRVQSNYFDQLNMAGHYERPADIERFAELGISKLRYPVLWETHEPEESIEIDWSWTEQQLHSIRKNKIVPIVGLVHHGSGPAFTNLLDKEFPLKLSKYAAKVAAKFPWIKYYTPVNEPLTTARFSGLYGFWYPHMQSELSFVQMLVNQLKGTVMCMEEIWKVNPSAKLVQTEDLSKTHSTPVLAYQAKFENERRWLTNDLLCGKVNEKHFFWKYFISLGIDKADLQFFLEHPCPPAVIGFNYYVTSERWLDERIENYSLFTHGSNGKHVYADTEAARTGTSIGLGELLKEAWQRYHLPLAITECHLSCTREDQLRWLKETWDTCCDLKRQGVNIRAVTAWSLLGAYDWNSLVTCNNNYYESGVFDVSNNQLRATSLGKMIYSIATTGDFDHPLFAGKGWWQRQESFASAENKLMSKKISPLMIIGKTGTLGNAFVEICKMRSIPYVAVGREDVDILNEQSINALVNEYRPWAMINATGYVRVDDAEQQKEECFAINTTAASLLAKVCYDHDIRFMSFSSDLVFDGEKRAPYHEDDQVLPLNIYGISKGKAEKMIMTENPSALIIRTSAFFGPWDKYNFVYAVLDAIQNNQPYYMAGDVIISPTYVPDLCHKAMDLFIDEEKGIWHLSNEGNVTWAEFGGIIAERSGSKKHQLISKPLAEMGWKAQRPLYSVLQSDKGIKLPPLHNALDRFFESRLA